MAYPCQLPLKTTTPARMPKRSLQRPPGLCLMAWVPLPVWILVLGASALLAMQGNMINKADHKTFATRHERESEYLCEAGDMESCRELSAAVQPH